MSNIYFTSVHMKENPNLLRQSYNQRFIKSLLSLVDSAGRGLRKEFNSLRNMINSLNPNEKFNPQLHAMHAFLVDSLKNNNASVASNLLEEISQILIIRPYIQSFGIRTISFETWEQTVLKSLKEQNRNQQGNLPSIDPIDIEKIETYSSIIHQSLRNLKNISPLFYEEFETYVTEIKLFHSDRLVGMTDPRVFGTIYLSICNRDIPLEVYFCEHIIHETSHLHLNTMFAQDNLILNSPDERYTAPIRPDPRPMYGIFHATFVLSRMVRVFSQLADVLPNASYKDCLSIFQKQFFNGYTTIQNYGKLTPHGQRILQSYSDLVTS